MFQKNGTEQDIFSLKKHIIGIKKGKFYAAFKSTEKIAKGHAKNFN
jgi:hypothetical protein